MTEAASHIVAALVGAAALGMAVLFAAVSRLEGRAEPDVARDARLARAATHVGLIVLWILFGVFLAAMTWRP